MKINFKIKNQQVINFMMNVMAKINVEYFTNSIYTYTNDILYDTYLSIFQYQV